MELIQLIWDFRGIDAEQTAKHQAVHLKEFVALEQWEIEIIDFESKTPEHAIAYMVVTKEQMRALRDVLKPHRGLLWNPN